MANKCEICKKSKRSVSLRATDRLECDECFKAHKSTNIGSNCDDTLASKEPSLGDIMRELRSMQEKLSEIPSIRRKLDDIQKSNVEIMSRVNQLEDGAAEKDVKMDKIEQKMHSLEIKVRAHEENCVKHDKLVNSLESKMDEQEQYSRRENLVISGLKISMSYATAAQAANGEQDNQAENITRTRLDNGKFSERDNDIMVDNIIKFAMDKLHVPLTKADIVTVHPLPKKTSNPNGQSLCIIRFANRNARLSVIQARKQLRGTNIYINEHLTPKNAHIFKLAREMRQKNRIEGCWTANCKVLVRNKDKTTWIKDRRIKPYLKYKH